MAVWGTLGSRGWQQAASDRDAIARFAHWGLRHGAIWGGSAALLSVALPGLGVAFTAATWQTLLVGAAVGVLAGPVLAVITGLVCVLAQRIPRWLFDAPDYLAALTMLALCGLVLWPLADPGLGPVARLVAATTLSAAAVVDAARDAAGLLRH